MGHPACWVWVTLFLRSQQKMQFVHQAGILGLKCFPDLGCKTSDWNGVDATTRFNAWTQCLVTKKIQNRGNNCKNDNNGMVVASEHAWTLQNECKHKRGHTRTRSNKDNENLDRYKGEKIGNVCVNRWDETLQYPGPGGSQGKHPPNNCNHFKLGLLRYEWFEMVLIQRWENRGSFAGGVKGKETCPFT